MNMASFSATQSLSLFNSLPPSLRLRRPTKRRWIVTMRDRSNNPRPLQKGRNLSIEAIQTVQVLKRSKKEHRQLDQVFNSKFRRLLKFDMMAVLRELLRQNECVLALKVFEDIRREIWYKPQVLLYADMIQVLGRNGFVEQVELLHFYLKNETNLKPEVEGFNALLGTLIGLSFIELTMECYCLMKQVGCEPDRSTFRILVNGLESMGELDASAMVRQDAQKYYGDSLDFLEEEKEELSLSLSDRNESYGMYRT